jgi:hypothetical protein
MTNPVYCDVRKKLTMVFGDLKAPVTEQSCGTPALESLVASFSFSFSFSSQGYRRAESKASTGRLTS